MVEKGKCGDFKMSEYDDRTEKICKDLGLGISITRQGAVVPPFSKGTNQYVYKYIVSISRQGQKIQFSFYDSINNYQQGLKPTKYDVLNTFAMEASSGLNMRNVQDVVSEFGYIDMKEATRVYKGLQNMGQKAQKLGLSFDDLSHISEYIDNV